MHPSIFLSPIVALLVLFCSGSAQAQRNESDNAATYYRRAFEALQSLSEEDQLLKIRRLWALQEKVDAVVDFDFPADTE